MPRWDEARAKLGYVDSVYTKTVRRAIPVLEPVVARVERLERGVERRVSKTIAKYEQRVERVLDMTMVVSGVAFVSLRFLATYDVPGLFLAPLKAAATAFLNSKLGRILSSRLKQLRGLQGVALRLMDSPS